MPLRVRLQCHLICTVFILLCVPVRELAAQSLEPCEEEVVRAEEHYRDGEFEEAERLLLGCLDQSLMSDEIAVRGYRILAQSQLQTGNIAGARRAVLRVFARNPGYRADPVQDPPAYQALVETVRQQLDDPAFAAELDQVRRERLAPIPESPDLPTYRAAGFAFVQVHVGANSYGGERGVAASSAFAEFADNAGPVFGVAAGYNPTDYLALIAIYEPGRYPTILTDKGSPFPVIDADDSSHWLHTLAGHLMARFLPTRLATPYLRGGVGASFIRLNDSSRGAVALDLGLGVDVAASDELGIYAELGGRYTFPGDAIDLVDRAGEFDFLSLVRAGIIWNVGSLR